MAAECREGLSNPDERYFKGSDDEGGGVINDEIKSNGLVKVMTAEQINNLLSIIPVWLEQYL